MLGGIYIPPIYKLHFNPDSIGKSLWITEAQAAHEFKDGRVVSRFSEYWVSKLYGFEKVNNSNNEAYDGIIHHELFGSKYISVKSLTDAGVKFQQSKFTGSGRTCNKQSLLESIEGIDYAIVVDITSFPTVITVPVDMLEIRSLVEADLLTCNGYKKDKFYRNILHMLPEYVKCEEITINEIL